MRAYSGLAEADRGKLIMACGTGKTVTSLKIAEDLVCAGGRVLFMVPSLALMSQTVREWTNDTDTPLRSLAVCSDAQVGKRRASNDDAAEIEAHDASGRLPDALSTRSRTNMEAMSICLSFQPHRCHARWSSGGCGNQNHNRVSMSLTGSRRRGLSVVSGSDNEAAKVRYRRM
nr:DEAD/DEAH box helicase family protein [Puniceibacterium antarcticum]